MVSRIVFLFPYHHQIDLPTSQILQDLILTPSLCSILYHLNYHVETTQSQTKASIVLSKISTMSYINGSTSANGGNGADNIQYAEFLNYPYVANGGWECHRCGCGSRTNTATTQWRPENYPRARRNREPLCVDLDCGHYRC